MVMSPIQFAGSLPPQSKPGPVPFTIVGAGYYGTRILGNLFVDGRLDEDAVLLSYVDPKPDIGHISQYQIYRTPGLKVVPKGAILQDGTQSLSHIPSKLSLAYWMNLPRQLMSQGQESPAFETEGKIPIFQQVKDWKQSFENLLQEMVIDLSLHEKVAPKALSEYIQAGVKRAILPKPFTFDIAKAERSAQEIKDHKVNAAVTSNWFYSDITKMVNSALAEERETYPVISAHINYSTPGKQINYVTHAELPHAIQILASTGLIDPDVDQPTVTQGNAYQVTAQYTPEGVTESVETNIELGKYANSPTGRERGLYIYLDDDDPEADIVASYDVKFDQNGQFVSPGYVDIDLPNNKQHIEFAEDTMTLMYKAMIKAMRQPFEEFIQDPTILTLENYLPIIRQVASIHKQWNIPKFNPNFWMP